MEIILKNKELYAAINFFQGLSLKTADSRHRSKFVKLLLDAYEEFGNEEHALMEKFDLFDSDGKLLEEGKRELSKVRNFNKEQAILADEKVVIEGGMFARNINEIPRILNEFEGELSGQDAEIYDRLLDEFEKNTDENDAK